MWEPLYMETDTIFFDSRHRAGQQAAEVSRLESRASLSETCPKRGLDFVVALVQTRRVTG
jgi:hypothetical protein